MNEIYKRKYSITTNCFDKNDYIRPSSILDLGQHISGMHAEGLGCGFDAFIEKGRIWLVVRNYIEVVKPIKNLQYVNLITYALKPMFVEMPRDVEFYDDKGELLYKLRMIWMIFDYKNNEVMDPKVATIPYVNHNGLFNQRIKKLPPIDKNLLKYYGDHEVRYSELDHNNHMNNSKYLDLFIDIYEDKILDIKNYQIEYVKQCYYKEKISLFVYNIEKKYYLFGYNNNDLKFYIKAEA